MSLKIFVSFVFLIVSEASSVEGVPEGVGGAPDRVAITVPSSADSLTNQPNIPTTARATDIPLSAIYAEILHRDSAFSQMASYRNHIGRVPSSDPPIPLSPISFDSPTRAHLELVQPHITPTKAVSTCIIYIIHLLYITETYFLRTSYLILTRFSQFVTSFFRVSSSKSPSLWLHRSYYLIYVC